MAKAKIDAISDISFPAVTALGETTQIGVVVVARTATLDTGNRQYLLQALLIAWV
ncbi:hypothetical protein D3C81_1116200 [compost metagenome]